MFAAFGNLLKRHRREWRGCGLWLSLCVGLMQGGCSAPLPTEVGPAPLRRMSNSEYLNTLSDLFPSQTPTLPPLPNDTEVAGFGNAAEVQQPSDVRIARFESIANIYSAGATRDKPAVQALTGCTYDTPAAADACAAQFITNVGLRIFRRPLTTEERDRLTLRFAAYRDAIDFEAAVQLTLSMMLQSPQFLYRPEPTPIVEDDSESVPVEPYAMASRLSFFLWESAPDDELLRAAANDELRTPEQVRGQAARMLADGRARRMYWSFHRQWLGLDRVLTEEQAYRTPEIDPNWSSRTQLAASRESQLFVENVIADGGSLKDLFVSRRAFVNAEMARVYGVSRGGDSEAFRETELPEGERAGLLTRAAFLAGLSHRGGNSPPIRGNGIGLHLFCRLPSSPPPDADLSMPTAKAGDGPKTTRMLFEERTAPNPCQNCHRTLNGVGFGFEHYNAAGAYQTQEQGLPIDSRGVLYGFDPELPFDGALELSNMLSESRDVYQCATQQWLRYALGRAAVDAEQSLVSYLTNEFHESQGDFQQLLLDICSSATFRMQRASRKPAP